MLFSDLKDEDFVEFFDELKNCKDKCKVEDMLDRLELIKTIIIMEYHHSTDDEKSEKIEKGVAPTTL